MTNKEKFLTRRSVLSAGWRAMAVAGLAGAPRIGKAANPGGRTLVCIYLSGGSDANNLIVPLESAQYGAYAQARGPIALPSASLRQVRTRSAQSDYGFHPALASAQNSFNQGTLAVVANVGSPVRQTGRKSGRHTKAGVESYRYETLAFVPGGYSTLRWAAARTGLAPTGSNQLYSFDSGVTMLPLNGARVSGASHKNPELMRAAASASLRTAFPETALGRQLKTVAGLIRSGAGADQVFVVPATGLTTANAELVRHASALPGLDAAIASFGEAMQEIGAAQRVTAFTDSEFGRTLSANATLGADPGWGNHQLVMGGAVLGGDIYGQFPDMLAGRRDSDGAWVPTTSTAQYHATLAAWMGVPDGEVPGLFPGLNSSSWRLGFLAG